MYTVIEVRLFYLDALLCFVSIQNDIERSKRISWSQLFYIFKRSFPTIRVVGKYFMHVSKKTCPTVGNVGKLPEEWGIRQAEKTDF